MAPVGKQVPGSDFALVAFCTKKNVPVPMFFVMMCDESRLSLGRHRWSWKLWWSSGAT